MKVLFVCFLSSICVSSMALGETWVGSGKKYSPTRQLVVDYNLTVEVTEQGNGRHAINVDVHFASGETRRLTCSMETGEPGWQKTCGNFNGGGYYFDNGLAQEYTSDGNGAAFLTQITFDGNSAMRILRTELQDEQVVAYYTESLRKD